MDIVVAKAAIQYEFENSEGFDEIEIDLFGGEPTLRKDFIKELVTWTCSSGFAKPFLFFLQTNGTLVHGDFQDWLLKHRAHVNVGLSLDGTPSTHNKNRCNSYERIDTAFFAKNYPAQGVRMTINSDTVGSLFEDIVHLHHLGFSRVDAFFAHGIDWNIDAIECELQTQLRLLCDYYLEYPEIKECSIFAMRLDGLLHKETKLQKWCGTGTTMVSVGVDGKKYPCQAFQPNTASNPIELGVIQFNEIHDFSDPSCLSCSMESVCPNCYGINYLMTGDILKRDKQFCKITKLCAAAVSYLRARQIEKGTSRMLPREIYQTIEAIQMLQRELAV